MLYLQIKKMMSLRHMFACRSVSGAWGAMRRNFVPFSVMRSVPVAMMSRAFVPHVPFSMMRSVPVTMMSRDLVPDVAIRSYTQGVLHVEHNEYWQALPSATITKGEGVFKECGDPYQYQVLEIDARNPFIMNDNNNDNNKTKIIIRPDIYPKIWEKVNQNLGKQFNLLVRGPPGIGKSVAFAAGYLLYQIRQTMMDDNDQRVQHVVCTAPSQSGDIATAAIYSRDGSARYVEDYQAQELKGLFAQKSTVWIQDDKQHGLPLESCRCVSILVASPKRHNYDRFIKLSYSCWLPVWDSGGALSTIGVPLELAALTYVAYPDISDREIKVRADNLGCIPRQICTTEELYQLNYKLTMSEARALSYDQVEYALNSIETKLGHDSISQRLLYTHVNRETLQAEGSVVVPAYHEFLLRTHTLGAVNHVAKLVESQLHLTGDRLAAGKQFERLMLQHLNVGSRVLNSRELEDAVKGAPASANAKSLTLERRELDHEVTPNGVKLPVLQVVSSLRNTQLSSRCFYVSRNASEPAIDAIYTSPTEIILIQTTLNKFHNCIGDSIFLHVQHALQYYEESEKPKVIYAILSDYETSSLMTKRKMVSTIKDERERTRRNEMLANIQQIVLAPDPDVFLSLRSALRRQ